MSLLRPGRTLLLALPFLLAPAPIGASPPAAARHRGVIELRVVGIRSDRGSVRVKLVQGSDGFPASEETAVDKRMAPADPAGLGFRFEDVGFGEYAVVVLHDEDDDAALDRSWLGIPEEGLGFSRDARMRFGPPDYEDSRFSLDRPRGCR